MHRNPQPDRPARSAPDTAAAVLDAAHNLFVREGLGALSVRKVARAAGYTTMVVYSHFGGKTGVVNALFAKGFSLLAAAQEAVPRDLQPTERVQGLCRAFIDLASEHPNYFQLMFGGAGPEYEPTHASRADALQTFGNLKQAVQAALPQSGLDIDDRSARIARQLFSLCYGWASLRHVNMLNSIDIEEIDDVVTRLIEAG